MLAARLLKVLADCSLDDGLLKRMHNVEVSLLGRHVLLASSTHAASLTDSVP